jgi:xylose isomerase
MARSLLAAASLVASGDLATCREERYAGWDGPLGARILDGSHTLVDLTGRVEEDGLDPTPRSGRQELMEQVVNRHIERAG